MTLVMREPRVGAGEQDSCATDVKTDLRAVIMAKFRDVAAAQGRDLSPLSEELVLLDSGLDSLCFAIIVATLEDELGYDPFTEAEEVYFPVTLGDFVRFYERAR